MSLGCENGVVGHLMSTRSLELSEGAQGQVGPHLFYRVRFFFSFRLGVIVYTVLYNQDCVDTYQGGLGIVEMWPSSSALFKCVGWARRALGRDPVTDLN